MLFLVILINFILNLYLLLQIPSLQNLTVYLLNILIVKLLFFFVFTNKGANSFQLHFESHQITKILQKEIIINILDILEHLWY